MRTVLGEVGQPGPEDVDRNEGESTKCRRRAGQDAQQGICSRIKVCLRVLQTGGEDTEELFLWTERHVPCWRSSLVILITTSVRLPHVNVMHARNSF